MQPRELHERVDVLTSDMGQLASAVTAGLLQQLLLVAMRVWHMLSSACTQHQVQEVLLHHHDIPCPENPAVEPR
jgi:hypothetical protein